MILKGLAFLASTTILLYNSVLSEPIPNNIQYLAQSSENYSALREHLAERNWELANEETHLLILNQVDPDEDWETENLNTYAIKAESIDQISCDLLVVIDQLWKEHSNGQYGFSTQAEVHWDVDEPSYSDETHRANERFFTMAQRLGWVGEDLANLDILEPRYGIDAPTGHLPYALMIWFGEGSLRSQSVAGQGPDAASSPFARKLAECDLSEDIPLTNSSSF